MDATKSEFELIKEYIDREEHFAYSIHKHDSLYDVLKDGKNLRETRLDAHRAAGQEVRKEHPSNQAPTDEMIAKGDILIWDLKEEYERQK